MEFVAEAASLTKPDKNGRAFSLGALQQMAEQCKGKRIRWNFDDSKPPIGIILSGEVVGDKLKIKGELFPGVSLPEGFVVPSFSVKGAKFEDQARVDTDVELVDFGLTQQPADGNIKPLEKC